MAIFTSCSNKINEHQLEFIKTRRWISVGGFSLGDMMVFNTYHDKLIHDTIIKKDIKVGIILKLKDENSTIVIKSLKSEEVGYYEDYGIEN